MATGEAWHAEVEPSPAAVQGAADVRGAHLAGTVATDHKPVSYAGALGH